MRGIFIDGFISPWTDDLLFPPLSGSSVVDHGVLGLPSDVAVSAWPDHYLLPPGTGLRDGILIILFFHGLVVTWTDDLLFSLFGFGEEDDGFWTEHDGFVILRFAETHMLAGVGKILVWKIFKSREINTNLLDKYHRGPYSQS